MKIPSQIIIKYIRDGCVVFYKDDKTWQSFRLLFKDKYFAHDAPGHYYIVIPTSCGNLLICIVTSQVEKRRRFYDDSAQKSLVMLSEDNFSFIDRPSVIDCNRAELLSRPELLARAERFRKMREKIAEPIKKQIISAILCSPLVKEAIKKVLPHN